MATKQDRDSGILLNELQPHDLLKFGLIPELIGRLPVITTLRALDRDQLVEILTKPKNALVKQYQKLLEYDHVDLEFQQEALEAAADKALERGIGARGLRAVLEATMTELMYEVPSDPTISKVIITADSVLQKGNPIVEHDNARLDAPTRKLAGQQIRSPKRLAPVTHLNDVIRADRPQDRCDRAACLLLLHR